MPREKDPFYRFWNKVEAQEDGCWLWTGTQHEDDYGIFQPEWGSRKTVTAHRHSYEMFYGPIPAGLQVDHVWLRGCRFRSCVNPYHLEAVTPEENARRAHEANALDPSRLAYRVLDASESFVTGWLHRVLHNKAERPGVAYKAGFAAAAAYKHDGRPWRAHAQEAWIAYETAQQSAA